MPTSPDTDIPIVPSTGDQRVEFPQLEYWEQESM